MVKGLEFFGDRFAAYRDQYVLIGGTAADTVMGEAGLEFRATKDLDIVLVVEALTAEFAEHFWAFIKEGQYEIRQRAETDKPTFYRFQKPADARFPVMVELFSRKPVLSPPVEDGHLTPIPVDEAVSSLSAILLDDTYYHFIMDGKVEVKGLMLVQHDRLIPLKALAWMENTARQAQGQVVKTVDIRKHINDVMRLSVLLAEDILIALPDGIAVHMRNFLDLAAREKIDLEGIGVAGTNLTDVLSRIARAYGLIVIPEEALQEEAVLDIVVASPPAAQPS